MEQTGCRDLGIKMMASHFAGTRAMAEMAGRQDWTGDKGLSATTKRISAMFMLHSGYGLTSHARLRRDPDEPWGCYKTLCVARQAWQKSEM